MQVILEFMDKGMKGMLSGDMSVYAIQQIQVIIEKQLPKMEYIQKELEKLEGEQDKLHQNMFKI